MASPMKDLNSSTSQYRASSPKILVVDDDDAVRRGLRAVLLSEGYEVITAVNGMQATSFFRRKPCDLALIDINMPLLKGWGTIGTLRRHAPSLPIVIITARPDEREIAREAGVELMEKPLDLSLLLSRISALLGKFTDRNSNPI
jgi:two-component system KDP operon response regulator KdpE